MAKETESIPMVEKDPIAEIQRLKERIIQKDKEYVAMEQVLEDKNGHLQFMLNAKQGDLDRLTESYDDLKFKFNQLTNENKFLIDQLDGKNFSFKERVRILFTGKAR